jgi:DNA-binding IclR family transcriptional regulator
MPRRARPVPPPERSAVDGGTHQSIARIDLLLSALAEKPEEGLRLGEVCEATGLGKATAHRLLTGLVAYRLADFDEASGRYLVGFKIFGWACGVGNRYGIAELFRSSLQRLADRFHDAVYLTVRNGDHAVCVERIEGSFPIKTLAFRVGDQRPLGVGAGSTAMLAMLPPTERQAVIARTEAERRRFPAAADGLASVLEAAIRDGYTFVDGMIVPGMCTVGAAVCLDSGAPVAAISISAIRERMQPERRAEIARAILAEIELVRETARPFFRVSNRASLLAGLSR